MKRSQFLHAAAGAAPLAAGIRGGAASEPRPLKDAIIGRTSRGNFGHNLDLVFNDRHGIEVVAVADPDATGRARARERSRARAAYADYREMLEKERPELVASRRG